MSNDPLMQQASAAVDQVRIPDFRNKLQNSMANTLPDELSGEMNRTLDNPDAMAKIKKQLQDERELAQSQDTKTMMLTGIVTALGGLFGAEQAGPAGAAAGLSGGLTGAKAAIDFNNELKSSREKEEEVDKLRRERYGILTPKDEMRLRELGIKEKKEARQSAQFQFKVGIDERDYGLRLDNFKARMMRMGQINEKEQGDIAANWNETLRKDKIYTEYLEQEKAGEGLLNLTLQARNGSALAGAALATAATKASGQVGALTDRDVAVFGGRQSIINKIDRWQQLALTGEPLTGVDLDEFEKLGQVFKESAQRKMIETEDSFIAKFAAERGRSRSSVSNIIRADKKPEAGTAQSTSTPAPVSNAWGYTKEQAKAMLDKKLREKAGKQ